MKALKNSRKTAKQQLNSKSNIEINYKGWIISVDRIGSRAFWKCVDTFGYNAGYRTNRLFQMIGKIDNAAA